jgi:hypothetical protein
LFFLKYSIDLAVKNHLKLNKKAFFRNKKEFLIHKEEKIKNNFEKDKDKPEKTLPINENKYIDGKASVNSCGK